MKKKSKKELNVDKLLINIFLCILLIAFIVVVLYYLVYKAENHEKLWDVHFTRIVNTECTPEAECVTPTIYTNSTSTGDYSVTFDEPGEKAIYEIDIVNDGSVDAEINNILFGSYDCKGNATDKNEAVIDAGHVCGNLEYNLYDKDNNKVLKGTILKAKEKVTYYLKLSYADYYYFVSEENRLSDTVTVRNLNLTIDYKQVK